MRILLILLLILLILILIYIYLKTGKKRETFIDRYMINDSRRIYGIDDLNNIYVDTGGGDSNEIVFQYYYRTGSIQYFTIPETVNELTFYCWGAGGGSKLLQVESSDRTYPFIFDSEIGIVVRPVVWYKFDDNLVLDSSGNNNQMENMGGVVDVNEYRRGSSSIIFRNNGYGVIPSRFELNHINLLKGISIIFWVRLDANSNSNVKIIEFGRNDKFMCIRREGARLRFQIVDGSTDVSYITPENSNYFNNRWIYIGWLINKSGDWIIYINNEKMSYNDKRCIIPLFNDNYVYHIGKLMTGNIDDFRIYDRILSNIEIRLMYEGGMSNSIIGLGGTGGFVKGTITNVRDFVNMYRNRLRIVVGGGGSENEENRNYLGGGIGKNGGGGGGLSGVFTDNEVLPIPLLVAGGGGGGGGELITTEIPMSYSKIVLIDGSNDAYVATNGIRKFPLSRQWDSIDDGNSYVFNGKNCYRQVLRYVEDGDYEIYYTHNNVNIAGMFNVVNNTQDGRFGLVYDINGNYKNSNYLDTNEYVGEWIVIKMSKPIVITSYKIRRYVDRNSLITNRAPIKFRLYGSIDGISWKIMDDVIEARYDNENYYNKLLMVNDVFNYFGIVVNKTFGNSDRGLIINKWEIYGYEMNRINNFINNGSANIRTYYGGNGGGEIGMDGNGMNDINGKGGRPTVGGEGGEAFMRNEINMGNNYQGGNGYVNQAGGGSGNFGGGSSGNRYENGRVIAIGGGGGGSSVVTADVFSFSRDTIMNIGNIRNGMIKAPMSDNRYYLGGVGEAGEDGLVVIEYRRQRVINRIIDNISNCNYMYIKYPDIIIDKRNISTINTSNLSDTNVVYTQTYDGISISYSSYKDIDSTPINLFDGNYKTNAYFGIEAKNGYNMNTGEYIGTNKYMSDDITTDGEWIMIRLNRMIRLRKYEFLINLENVFNTMAAGKWKLYAKRDDRFILLDEMNTRMTTSDINNYYYKQDMNNREMYIFSKNICENDVESDTYLLIINGLAMMGKMSRRATMAYLGFSEFGLYDGVTTNIVATGRVNLVTR